MNRQQAIKIFSNKFAPIAKLKEAREFFKDEWDNPPEAMNPCFLAEHPVLIRNLSSRIAGE